MKVSITIELELSEAEVEQAVHEYVSNQGYRIDKVVLNHEEGGAIVTVKSDSPTPTEQERRDQVKKQFFDDDDKRYVPCPECNDSGWTFPPYKGYEKNSKRCSRGCPTPKELG